MQRRRCHFLAARPIASLGYGRRFRTAGTSADRGFRAGRHGGGVAARHQGGLEPPPEGVWGMPPDMLKTLPGYGPDVQKNRAEARGIIEKLGYGPDKRLRMV